MVEKPNNEPAFPQVIPDSFMQAVPGMTLRDWFAGQALAAIITATSAGQHNPDKPGDDRTIIQAMARDAYELADAILAERSK